MILFAARRLFQALIVMLVVAFLAFAGPFTLLAWKQPAWAEPYRIQARKTGRRSSVPGELENRQVKTTRIQRARWSGGCLHVSSARRVQRSGGQEPRHGSAADTWPPVPFASSIILGVGKNAIDGRVSPQLGWKNG